MYVLPEYRNIKQRNRRKTEERKETGKNKSILKTRRTILEKKRKKEKKNEKESRGNLSDLSIGHSHPIMCEDTLSCLSYVVTPYHVITIMSTDNDDLWLSCVMAYNPIVMTTRPSVNYILPT